MRRSCVKPITALLALLGTGSVYRAGAAIYQESGGIVAVEAEHFDNRVADPADSTHTWKIVPDEDAGTGSGANLHSRGGKYIQSLPDAGQNKNTDASVVGTEPYVDYKVFIKTPGTYRLYLRFGGWDGASDSIYAQILEFKKSNGGPGPDWYRYIGVANPPDDTTIVDFDLVKDSTTGGPAKGWNGDAEPNGIDGGPAGEVAANFAVTNPGVYTVRISQREDGSAVDAILLQLSSLPEPTTPGPAESAVATTYISFTTQPVDSAISQGTAATFKIAATGSGTVTYQWQTAPAGGTTFTDIAGATSATYTTGNLTQADEGTQFRANVTVPGLTLPSAIAKVILDQTPPAIVGALGSPDGKSVMIRFNEKVSQATAETLANYTITGLTLSAPKLQANGTDVILNTTAQTANTPYTITVNGVKDLAGNAESNLTANFAGATYVNGGVLQKYWDAITTNTPDTLRADPRFPDSPTSTTIEPRFEYPPNGANEAGSNYGNMLSGWIVPPKDGDYVFFLCSDDLSDLFLSIDDTSANKKLIAQETVWSNPRQWVSSGGASDLPSKRSDQFSGTLWPGGNTIHLLASKRYYIEVQHTEGGGGDNVSVLWQLPGAPEPTDGSLPIDGSFVQVLVDPTAVITVTQQPANVTGAAATPASFSVAYTSFSAFGTNATVKWQRAPAGSTTFTDIAGATGKTYTIPFLAPSDNGAQIRAAITASGTTVNSSAATVTVNSDTTPPTLTGIVGTASSAQVSFSEPLDPATAVNKANYTLSGGVTVSSATVVSAAGAATIVRLDLTRGTAGTTYNVTVGGVKDLSGNTIATATQSFTAFNIFANFNDGQAPAGAGLTGTAILAGSGSYDGGPYLQLTPAAGNSQGTIVFPSTDTASVSKLTVLWKMFIGNGSGNPADGVALSISDGIDDTANFGEEGAGSGLIISFDTYDNAGGEAPAISVKFGGTSEEAIDAGGNQVGKSNVVKAVLVNNLWVDVNVQVTADGKVTVIHNNVKYFDNVPIAGWTPLSNPRVAIGGRTGGEFERAGIDDFQVLFNADFALAQPPTVTITSPADQATFPVGATILINVNAQAPGGAIAKVEFFANGQSIGSSTTAPYTFTVPNVPEGAYTVVAKVTDGRGVTVPSAPVKVIVGNPKKVYFVTADPGPLTFIGDQTVYDHLSNRGFNVIAARGMDVPDDGSTANGTDLIVQSSSLGSGTVEIADPAGGAVNISKFKTLAIPAIEWEASNLDAWGFQELNGAPGTFVGSQIKIVDAASPLAAGLPAGNTTVVTSDQTFSEADNPVGTAPAPHIVAVNPSDDAQKLIFYYLKGEKGFGDFVMPEKRIFFFFQDNTAAAANDNGWKLFDAAVDFALGTTTPGGGAQPSATISVSGNSVTISSSNGGTVQATDALSANTAWADLGLAPQTVQTTGKARFFRIKK